LTRDKTQLNNKGAVASSDIRAYDSSFNLSKQANAKKPLKKGAFLWICGQLQEGVIFRSLFCFLLGFTGCSGYVFFK